MVNARQHDFTLDGKGFALVRATRSGRSWHRRPVADVPGSAGPDEIRFGNLPATLRFTEVFDDFSGGDGWAYRSQAPPNGVHWSENFDTRFPGQAVHCQEMLRLTGTLQGSFNTNAESLFDLPYLGAAGSPALAAGAGGVGIIHNGPTTGHITYLEPFAAASFGYISEGILNTRLGHRPVLFGSYFYVPEMTGTGFFQRRTTNTIGAVQATLPASRLATVSNRLWRAFGPEGYAINLRSVAAEASVFNDADYSATLRVGAGARSILDMVGFNGQLFLGMPDGLYAGDSSGTFVGVTGLLSGQVNRDNFRDLAVHEGEVVFPHVSGVYAYNPTITSAARIRQISPPQRSSRSPVRGVHRCLESYGGWLYAGLWTGSASYLRAGREVGPGDWRWHTLNRLPHTARIHRLHFDGVTYATFGQQLIPNRLWVATDASIVVSGTAPLYFHPVPQTNGNPLADDPAFLPGYNGSARLDLPSVDRNAPGVLKVWESVEVWSDATLSGRRYADVYYTADRGTRTLAGRVQISPVTTLVLGSLNGSFVSGRALEVSLESFTDTSGCAPVYRAVVVRGRLLPKYVEMIDAVVRASDGITDRYGTPMRPAAVIVDDLRAMADPLRDGGRPHQLVDLAGATSWVTLKMPEETEVWQQGIEEPELALNVQMAVMTMTGG